MTLVCNDHVVMADTNERNALEEAAWKAYINSQDLQKGYVPTVNYYIIYLLDQIMLHLKKEYRVPQRQEHIRQENIKRLPDVLAYSLGKGHFAAYAWITKITDVIEVSQFSKPEFEHQILLNYQKSLVNGEIIPKTLKNDINGTYLAYLDRICENMYGNFMQLSQVLFFKGFLQAIRDIGSHYGVTKSDSLTSPLSALPVGHDVEITPAMRGRYLYGDKLNELWSLKWDIAYSQYDYESQTYRMFDDSVMLAHVLRTTLSVLRYNAEHNVSSYKIVEEHLKQDSKAHLVKGNTADDTPILILEFFMLSAIREPHRNPHSLSHVERMRLEETIQQRFATQTNINIQNSVIIFND